MRRFVVLSLIFIFSFAVFARPGQALKPAIHAYNGLRFSTTHGPFRVAFIESTDESILVTFNVPVDSSSLKRQNILIDGLPLKESTPLRFNRTGEILEIKTELSVGTKFTLEFKNAKSYDGEELSITFFDSLLPWAAHEYPPQLPQ